MLHEIGPGRYHNEYRTAAPGACDTVIFYKNDSLLAAVREGQLTLPRYEDCALLCGELTYLFSIDGRAFFLSGDTEPFADFSYISRRGFRGLAPVETAFAAITACSLGSWYGANRFCGRCGAGMQHDDKERMLRCPNCGQLLYPKISPAIIAAVTNGEKLLLTKYAGRTGAPSALVAGFNEIGEPIEDTVRREVMEEVGLRVKNLRFYKSQPWPLTDTLLMGFWCEVDGDDRIRLDRTELGEAVWVQRSDISVKFDGISLTNEMISAFRKGLENT